MQLSFLYSYVVVLLVHVMSCLPNLLLLFTLHQFLLRFQERKCLYRDSCLSFTLLFHSLLLERTWQRGPSHPDLGGKGDHFTDMLEWQTDMYRIVKFEILKTWDDVSRDIKASS